MTATRWGLPTPRVVAGSDAVALLADGERLAVHWKTESRADARVKSAAMDLLSRAAEVEAIDVGSADSDQRATVTVTVDALWQPSEGEVAPARGLDPRPEASDERFALTVTEAGQVTISAATAIGALHALVRLGHLLNESVKADGGWLVPVITAVDGPTWRWRGLSVDTVRHFYPVTELKRVIDLGAWHGLSVIHLHLTDVQDWRIELECRPELTAGNPDIYTREDFRHLVDHAAARGIVLIPEIDLPGHTAAAVARLPELADGAIFAHPMLTYLDPRSETVQQFTRDVLTELAALSPSNYVHLGGDEAFGMPEGLYGDFIDYAVDIIRAVGKKPLAWQEGIRGTAFGSGDALQVWMSPEDAFDVDKTKQSVPEAFWPMVDVVAETFALAPSDAPAAASAGVEMIASPSGSVYLDRRYAEPSLDDAQNDRLETLGFEAYGPKPTSSIFSWDPEQTPEIVSHGGIVGGAEAAIWSETITSFDDLAMLLLPRLGILAERFWASGDEPAGDIAERASRQAAAWTRLGFGSYFRSTEVFTT